VPVLCYVLYNSLLAAGPNMLVAVSSTQHATSWQASGVTSLKGRSVHLLAKYTLARSHPCDLVHEIPWTANVCVC
jgi:hypothetical protein